MNEGILAGIKQQLVQNKRESTLPVFTHIYRVLCCMTRISTTNF